MHIQHVTGVNTKQRQNTILESNHLTGTNELFNQHKSGIPDSVANNISVISNDQVNSIDTKNSTPATGYPPKITIINYQFVIPDQANGLVYNYQVISIDGAWSISLSSIVG